MKQVQGFGCRQRFTPQQRVELLDQYESAGLSVADFATTRGIGTSTFFSWLSQRRRRSLPTAGKSRLPLNPFQEISLPAPMVAPIPWAGEVELPDGTQVRWSSQTAPASLHELLAHLRAC
jgi:hypothetical protein